MEATPQLDLNVDCLKDLNYKRTVLLRETRSPRDWRVHARNGEWNIRLALRFVRIPLWEQVIFATTAKLMLARNFQPRFFQKKRTRFRFNQTNQNPSKNVGMLSISAVFYILRVESDSNQCAPRILHGETCMSELTSLSCLVVNSPFALHNKRTW